MRSHLPSRVGWLLCSTDAAMPVRQSHIPGPFATEPSSFPKNARVWEWLDRWELALF